MGRGREDVCATASRFAKLVFPARRAVAADGIRCDVDGNVWAGARPGVQVLGADGRAHRHDPAAGNLREPLLRRRQAQSIVHDRESVALYAVYVKTTGAHIA